MPFTQKGAPLVLSIITITLAVLFASFLLIFGVANLVHPDVPESDLNQNTRVCTMFVLTGLISIYAIFRPYIGGITLSICGLVFFVVVITNPVAVPAIVLGVLSIIRGRLTKETILEKASDDA
jgi:NhaP-type Na+/H+ or K+/H+ antiporter